MMTTLNFHTDIYDIKALERSVTAFEAHATFDQTPHETSVEVSITSNDDIDQQELVGAFVNYVLVETVQTRKSKELN